MVFTFSVANWCVLAAYIVGISLLGSLFYRRRTSASDFFLGGRRMRALPVAISLVAADLSAVSYMGAPAWTYQHNLALVFSSCAYVLAAPVVMYVFMPFWARFKFYSAYEYLERRFDLKTRLFGSAVFLLLTGSHVAVVIYAPSLILSLLTGLPVWACVLAMGACTTAYTTLGGMRAVIWTDVAQFSVLVGGLLLIVGMTMWEIPGGLGTVMRVAGDAGRLDLWKLSFDLTDANTLWATFLGGGVMVLATLGTSQTYLQRYFTTRSLEEGRRALLLDAVIVVPVAFLLYGVGAMLFTYYQVFPDRLPVLPSPDAILPSFVVSEFGGIVPGLVVASIFAASMAVMSASINALTTITTIDFYQRLFRPEASERDIVWAGRIGTVLWGTVATGAAMYAHLLGPLANAINLLSSFLGGPILGVFLLGMLTRRVDGTSAFTGGLMGALVVTLVAWRSSLAFFYFTTVGVLVTMAAAWGIALLRPAPRVEDLRGLVRGLDPVDPRDPIQSAPPVIVSPEA